MEKVSIVYWSQTGNTEAMAKMIAKGVEEAGAKAELIQVSDANADELLKLPGFAIGCPAMGAEELEDAEVEPFVASIEGKVSGKSLLLFGSYDWGDGEWMRIWQDRMTAKGASLVTGEGVIANNSPDAEAEAKLKAAGAELAKL
ncbi:flavodoxin [Johnsonella ignava ATCC 51276]|jgi:flavodoxin|uniref:Flavodoxin n=1 Tax=Johnsonella ignava ATCC 51276 TaxID=679200 RepID=G5GHC0_9FIRM|nr:flavodoxin [Johnsonella ignava]EHI55917.1 flavodoxin [Johnsonella ignava ATCC 51276]